MVSDRNWEDFYKKLLEDNSIPFHSCEDITKDAAEICGLAVNLADVMKRIPETCKKIRIFADVVIVPPNYTCLIRQGYLYLFARVITAGADSRFLVDYEQDGHTAFAAYYQKTEGEAELVFSGRSGDKRTKEVRFLESGKTGYAGIKYQMKKNEINAVKVPQVPAIDGRIREKLELLTAAQLASAFFISYSDRGLAIELLNWVLMLMKNTDIHKQLYMQAYAYRNVLSAKNQPHAYVPALDREQYYKQAAGYLELFKEYEAAYFRFQDKTAGLEERRKSVRLMYDLQENGRIYAENALRRAEEDYKAAWDSCRQAAFNFQLQQDYLSNRQKQFEIEFSYWCGTKKIDAAVEIVKGIFTLSISIITLVVGAVALGPAAGAACGGTASSGEQAVNVLQEKRRMLEKIHQIIEKAADPKKQTSGKLKDEWEKVTKTVGNLVKCLSDLDRLYESSVNMDSITGDAAMAGGWMLADESQADGQPLYWWDIYEQDVLLNLSPYQELGAPGIESLTAEFKKYILYGKAAIRAKEAAVQKGQEYGSLLLENRRISDNRDRMMQEFGRLTDEELETEKLQMHFSEQMTNMKRWICIVMENYGAAYEYWTLRRFPVPVVPAKDAAGLKQDLLKVYENWQKVLEGLNPPPQEFRKLSVCCRKNQDAEFDTLAEQLKEKNEIQILIPEDSPVFAGHSRVRLDTVRVWLHGAEREDSPVIFEIRTSGDHADRLEKTWHFSMEPFRRKFQYVKQRDGSFEIQKDGKVSREFAGWYVQPTPFTQWTISLLTPEAVCLDALEEIELEFEGSSV